MAVLRIESIGCLALVVLVLAASAASAQTAPPLTAPDPESASNAATMRWGPLSLRSTIALSNIGADTNVFNRPAETRLPGDFTLTFTPTTNLWLRMGRTWFDGTVQVDWVYFNKYASERGANSLYRMGVTRAFNRLRFSGGAQRDSRRDRPTLEIDARSQRFERGLNGEVSMRVFGKTSVGAKTRHRRMTFDKDAVFLGTNLAVELNRDIINHSVFARHALTPLTTVTLEAGIEDDRFVNPVRNADSTRINGTFELQPSALINGYAIVGYRHFTPQNRRVPAYRGLTALTNLVYRLRPTTRVGTSISRDVQHAFNALQPYFIETQLSVFAQQQVFGPFDVLARMAAARIAYRDLVGAVVQISNQVERVQTYGGGMGYRLGADKRVGFTIEYQERITNITRRRFQGVRYGMSITYER